MKQPPNSPKKTPLSIVTPPLRKKKSTQSDELTIGNVIGKIKRAIKDSFQTSKPKSASLTGGEQDKWRFVLVWLFMGLGFVVVLGRAIHVQVLPSDELLAKSVETVTTERPLIARRGLIVDRTGAPLAANAPLVTVFFDAYAYAKIYYETNKELQTAKGQAVRNRAVKKLEALDLAKLAAVTNYPLEKLQKAADIKNDIVYTAADVDQQIKQALPTGQGVRRVVLFDRVSPEIAASVRALNLSGIIGEDVQYRRYYLQAEPNAQILGYMGREDGQTKLVGKAGIELRYNTLLAGKDGKLRVLHDRKNQAIQELEEIAPLVKGEDVVLTIDSRLQYVLYKELEQVGRLQSARSSSGMVVDVKTGEIMAMGSWPSFNSNKLSDRDGANERNRPLMDVFEPGSVVKPFTVAAALESGKYSATTIIDTNPGSVLVGGYTIRDGGNYGAITLDKLIQKSSNVASTKIALNLPADAIANMQKKFGFGTKTALDFPAESAGKVATPKERELSRRATLSYGYGQQVTLAQLTQAYAALGNRGLMQPLTLVKEDNKQEPTQVISAEHAESIVGMMELVTGPGGTGQAAAINGYRVAGKTGTSRRTNPQGGYYTDQHRTIFVGLAPASNPRFAVAILVEDPRKESYAGQVSAPVFRNVMQEALRLYNVPYDKPLQTEEAQAKESTN